MQTLSPTWSLSDTATTKWYVRLLPSLNDVAFLLPAVALFSKMNGTQLLFSDGDTGWHIRTGEWILANHSVPKTDIFSFTRPHDAWFAWEWLWDVAFALIHQFAGLGGVGFVTTLVLCLFSLLVYRLALRISQNNVMSIAVTALSVAVSSLHWLARPHLVSWIFTLLFLHALESARCGRRKMLHLLPVLMMFWVNLHAGFMAGVLVLGCYALGEGLTAWFEEEPAEPGSLKTAWHRSSPYWKSLALCLVATLINPYGWQLHKHVIAYLTDAELLDKIQEFQSISFHAGPALMFETMLVLAAFVVFSKLQSRTFTPVLLICLWAHYALLCARHIPIFMFVAAPFVATLLSSAASDARTVKLLSPLSNAVNEICSDFRAMELSPRLHVLPAIAIFLLAGLFAAGRPPFAAQFNAETFPAQVIPLLSDKTSRHVFTTDQWADYLLYRLYPAQKVFFDGRSDFYGNDFIRVNQQIAGAEHDWKLLLKKFGIELVVIKPEMPLSAVLKLTSGSKVLFDDGKVIVFDISGLYHEIPGSGNTAKRAASFSQTLQSTPRGVVSTTHTMLNSQKG